MKVVLEVEHEPAAEHIMEHKASSYWFKEEDQIVIHDIDSVHTTNNGGIVVHIAGDEDIVYPEVSMRKKQRPDPPIRIITVK